MSDSQFWDKVHAAAAKATWAYLATASGAAAQGWRRASRVRGRSGCEVCDGSRVGQGRAYRQNSRVELFLPIGAEMIT